MARPPAASAGSDDGPPHERELLFTLLRLAELAARPFQEDIGRRHGLGLSEWRVLAVLHDHPGSAASEVAQRTGLDKMSVSRALASLEAAGRVVRRPDPDDGRRALATLTAAGRQLHRGLLRPSREREAAVAGGLSAAERRQLAVLVARMTGAARAAGDTAETR
ncbi:MAG: hypothetical protein RJA99_398 [Pseudomonadota bacterium]|jgi:DNA-binding MarR family transcriptional regulator